MELCMAPLAAILDLNTDLLRNCLDGVSDAEGRQRLPGGANSMRATHVVCPGCAGVAVAPDPGRP